MAVMSTTTVLFPDSLHLSKKRKERERENSEALPVSTCKRKILTRHSQAKQPPCLGSWASKGKCAAGVTRARRASPPQNWRWPDASKHPEENTNKQVFMRAVTQLTEASSLSVWNCPCSEPVAVPTSPHVSTPQNPISEQCGSDRSKRHNMQLQGAFEQLLNCKEQRGFPGCP